MVSWLEKRGGWAASDIPSLLGTWAVSAGHTRARPREQRLTWGALLGLPVGPGSLSACWGRGLLGLGSGLPCLFLLASGEVKGGLALWGFWGVLAVWDTCPTARSLGRGVNSPPGVLPACEAGLWAGGTPLCAPSASPPGSRVLPGTSARAGGGHVPSCSEWRPDQRATDTDIERNWGHSGNKIKTSLLHTESFKIVFVHFCFVLNRGKIHMAAVTPSGWGPAPGSLLSPRGPHCRSCPSLPSSREMKYKETRVWLPLFDSPPKRSAGAPQGPVRPLLCAPHPSCLCRHRRPSWNSARLRKTVHFQRKPPPNETKVSKHTHTHTQAPTHACTHAPTHSLVTRVGKTKSFSTFFHKTSPQKYNIYREK